MATVYSNAVKKLVATEYPLCQTKSDREKLAIRAGIVDDGYPNLTKLYNLATRLNAVPRPQPRPPEDYSQPPLPSPEIPHLPTPRGPRKRISPLAK